MKYQTISLLLILTNLSPSRPTNLDDPNSPHCTIVQPFDLDVLYANDAEVVLELRRGPSARGGRAVAKALRVSVRVDGAAAGLATEARPTGRRPKLGRLRSWDRAGRAGGGGPHASRAIMSALACGQLPAGVTEWAGAGQFLKIKKKENLQPSKK